MSKKINNNELKSIGFYELELFREAGKLAKGLIKQKLFTKEEILEKFRRLIDQPEQFLQDEHLMLRAILIA